MELTITAKGKSVKLTSTETSLHVQQLGMWARSNIYYVFWPQLFFILLPDQEKREVLLRQVISANFRVIDGLGLLEVYYLFKTKTKEPFSLHRVEGSVKSDNIKSAEEWVEALMSAAYEGEWVLRYFR